MRIQRRQLIAALVGVLTLAVFLPLCRCGWTWWDDQETLHHNPRLNPPTLESLKFYWTALGDRAPMGLYVPVTYTLWAGVASIARLPAADEAGIQLDPGYFHAFNVMVHAGSAVLVYLLLYRFVRKPWAAAAGALLFALHPVQVETVGWISGGKDLLSGFFSLVALLLYVISLAPSTGNPGEGRGEGDFERQESPGIRNHPHAPVPERSENRAMGPDHRGNPVTYALWTAATLALLAAMLSKPTAIAVPLIAVAIDLLLLRRLWRKVIISAGPWLLLMIPLALITSASQPAPWSSPLPIIDRPAIAADAIVFYLAKIAFPLNLCVDYGRRTQNVIGHAWWAFAALLPVVVILCWFLWRKSFLLPAAALLFLLPIGPLLGLIPFDFQFISTTADHYLYLALLGPALLIAVAAKRFDNRVMVFAIIIMLAALSIRTILQESIWENDQTLFERTLAVNPASFTACDILGFDHLSAGQRWVDKGRQAAAAHDPQVYQCAASATDEFNAAAARYEQGLSIYPDYVPSLFNLTMTYESLGKKEDARRTVHHILEIQPTLPAGLRADPPGLAGALLHFGDVDGALNYVNAELAKDPGNAKLQQLRETAMRVSQHKLATTHD